MAGIVQRDTQEVEPENGSGSKGENLQVSPEPIPAEHTTTQGEPESTPAEPRPDSPVNQATSQGEQLVTPSQVPQATCEGEQPRKTSGKRKVIGLEEEEEEEEDDFIAEIDKALAGPSTSTGILNPFQFVDTSFSDFLSLSQEDLQAQAAEMERLRNLKEAEEASLLEIEKTKKEEARAYQKVAEGHDVQEDPTTLQLKEMQRIEAEKMAKIQERMKKKLDVWNEYVRVMEYRRRPEPITDIKWEVNSNKKIDLTVYRGHNPLDFNVLRGALVTNFGFSEWVEMHNVIKKKKGRIATDFMDALGKRFQWKVQIENKYKVDPLKPLSEQGPLAESQRKRRREEGEEGGDGNVVFVRSQPTGKGLDPRNLTLPTGVTFREGKVIKTPVHGMFFTNNTQQESFQRVDELHLCSTFQLILLKGTCQRGSNDAEFLQLLELELEPRDKDLRELKKTKLEELNLV